MEELERTARHPHAQRALRVLDILTGVAVIVKPSRPLRVSDHESDNRFYECADAASTDFIIAGNLRHFKQSHGNTQIANPRQFVELLRILGRRVAVRYSLLGMVAPHRFELWTFGV